MEGTWALQVETPFGTHPATLTFERERGGTLGGHIKSRLGDAPLSGLNETGAGFDAVVSLAVQGRTYEANINGQTEGDQINGTINIKFPLAPRIKFTGTRAG